jgi:D-alanine-D-alanine ligase
MRVGLTFDLKTSAPPPGGAPDDLFEEFDDPSTVHAIADVLRSLGHEPVELGDGPDLVRKLLADPPDFVFNIAEGTGIGRSREARVPAVLELLGIPYAGPDPLTAAVTLDKECAKRIVSSAGVRVPAGWVFETDEDLEFETTTRSYLPFTCIVKPAWEGSSKGIRAKCITDSPEELAKLVRSHWSDYRQPVLVDEYIDGAELTVGIVGNKPPQVLGTLHVMPKQDENHFIYSLEVKRNWRERVRYECPPKLPPARVKAVEDAALKAYRVLGCRDVARIDFRLRDGVPYFIEANPLPGLNPINGDIVMLAAKVGVSHAELIGRILSAAIDRHARPL